MKYANQYKAIFGRHGVLSFTSFVVLSIACQASSSSHTSQSQPGKQVGNSAGNAHVPSSQLAATTPEAKTAMKPSVEITEVPSKGAGPNALETIAGTVSGVKINECKVVVFARTNVWYVQPYIDSSDTSISDNNTWRTDTHLGSQYAVLLVKNSYKPPTSTGKLPNVAGLVLAVATVNARQ